MGGQNTILLSIDTLRSDEVGCINPDSTLTPNLDKFAADGKVFSNCFSQGPNTRPSFCSMMSSTYPLMYGDYRKRGILGRISIAELLKKKGFATAGFHSNPFLGKQYGYGRGFEEFYDGMRRKSLLSRLGERMNLAIGDRRYKAFKMYYFKLKKSLGIPMKSAKNMPYAAGGSILELGKQFLRTIRNPFFLWLHFMDVHTPYPDSDDDLPLKIRQAAVGKYTFSRKEVSELYGCRKRQIRAVDRMLAEFFDFLHDKGLYDTTNIYIASDHGEEFLEHGELGHVNRLYDELIHVPLITNVGGGLDKSLCENTDMPVSILSAHGLSKPGVFMGRRLEDKKDVVFSETTDPMTQKVLFSARTGRWKLIETLPQGTLELYDLESDPGETENVAQDNKDIVKLLKSKLAEHESRKKAVERKTPIFRMKMGKW